MTRAMLAGSKIYAPGWGFSKAKPFSFGMVKIESAGR
jgi:hypothetical protein